MWAFCSRLAYTALCALLFTVPAVAGFSGLTMIPTADVLASGELSVSLSGTSAPSGENESFFLNTQYGFSDRFEAGIDIDISKDADPRLYANAKYLLQGETDRWPALAVGFWGLAEDTDISLYLVGTRSFDALRAHAGLWHTDGQLDFMLGLDYAATDQITLLVDYISGDGNFASAGIDYQFTDNFGILGSALFPNAGGAVRYTIYLYGGGLIRW